MNISQSSFQFKFILLSLPLLFLLQGCRVSFVSDYDPEIIKNLLTAYKEVDNFYINLLNTSPDDRLFAKFQKSYSLIESDLRILVLQNQARPLNEESTQQAQNILDLWKKYKVAHQKNDSYKDALLILHQERFYEMFTALFKGEKAKPLNEG